MVGASWFFSLSCALICRVRNFVFPSERIQPNTFACDMWHSNKISGCKDAVAYIFGVIGHLLDRYITGFCFRSLMCVSFDSQDIPGIIFLFPCLLMLEHIKNLKNWRFTQHFGSSIVFIETTLVWVKHIPRYLLVTLEVTWQKCVRYVSSCGLATSQRPSKCKSSRWTLSWWWVTTTLIVVGNPYT